jgi:type VI secretion system protein ImpL
LSSFNSERWNTIIRDLERYRLKNPNSSLLALETFLTTMATDVDASNCNDRVVQSAVQQRSGDYFAQRQQQLTTALRSRCQELRGREQREQWEHFTTLFNRIAAGRPPFATPGWPVETPPMGTDELAQLLGTYDRAQRSLRDVGRDSRQTNAITARRFLDQFERINTFLQPLVPAEEGSPSGYDMQVEFRANAQGEVEGQNIIDWAIDVGGQHLGWRETPRALHWEPGQPISLSWRLAKDGPVMPKFDDRQSAMHVDQQQRVVTLRYTDHWALLSLLMQHRDLETVGRRDPRSQLLHVEFPLAIQPDSPGGDVTESRARVYLRLTLSPTGKRGTLTWPGSFPTRAPEIQP